LIVVLRVRVRKCAFSAAAYALGRRLSGNLPPNPGFDRQAAKILHARRAPAGRHNGPARSVTVYFHPSLQEGFAQCQRHRITHSAQGDELECVAPECQELSAALRQFDQQFQVRLVVLEDSLPERRSLVLAHRKSSLGDGLPGNIGQRYLHVDADRLAPAKLMHEIVAANAQLPSRIWREDVLRSGDLAFENRVLAAPYKDAKRRTRP